MNCLFLLIEKAQTQIILLMIIIFKLLAIKKGPQIKTLSYPFREVLF